MTQSRLLAGILFVASAQFLCTAKADPAPKTCQIIQLESLDMDTVLNGEFTLPASLNNRPFEMLVDTGSDISSISADVAQQINATMGSGFNTGAFLNGVSDGRYTILDSFAFGRLHSSVRWPVIIDPEVILSPTEAGLVGADFLSNYDVEFDFYRGKMNFFGANSCPNPVYWASEYSEVPMLPNPARHIIVNATLDGKAVKVFLDTGSPNAVMSLDAARRLFGWRDDDPRVKFLANVSINGGATAPFYSYPFATLNFGGVAVQNPKINLIPRANFNPHGDNDAQIIMGMNVIRQLHLLVAYKENTLYLTGAEATRLPAQP